MVRGCIILILIGVIAFLLAGKTANPKNASKVKAIVHTSLIEIGKGANWLAKKAQ